MRQVLLDVNSLCFSQITGIGVYARELCRAFSRLQDPEFDLRPVVKLSRWRRCLLAEKHLEQRAELFWGTRSWNLFRSSTDEGSRRSLYHGLDFRVPFEKGFTKLVTVHDLGEFEEEFSSPEFLKIAVKNFESMLFRAQPDHILTVSQSVASSFVERYPQFQGRISTIPLGADHQRVTPEEGLRAGSPPRLFEFPYLLYVGTVEKRKNVLGLLHAFESIASRHRDLRLIIVGKDGHEAHKVDKALEVSPFRERIRRTKFVEGRDLKSLFAHAEVFAFPSFYEGFGLPILEAMQWGRPVLTSARGSMAEISGDAAFLVDPKDVDLMAAGLERLLSDSALRTRLSEAGPRQASLFTWEKTARQTLELYRRL